MLKSYAATDDPEGRISLHEPVHVTHPCRAILTLIDDPEISETALLSEATLAEDWNRPEEDEAWVHLQHAQ